MQIYSRHNPHFPNTITIISFLGKRGTVPKKSPGRPLIPSPEISRSYMPRSQPIGRRYVSNYFSLRVIAWLDAIQLQPSLSFGSGMLVNGRVEISILDPCAEVASASALGVSPDAKLLRVLPKSAGMTPVIDWFVLWRRPFPS